jgi:hypothetical protein
MRHASTAPFSTLVTALTAVLLFLFCSELGFSSRKASAAALVFGLASPAAPYAKQDFAQPLASLMLLLAFLYLVRTRNGRWTNFFAAGLSLGCAILTRPELIALAMPFFLAYSFFNPADVPLKTRVSNFGVFGLPLAVLVALNQYFNFLKFGSLFSVGYSVSSEFTTNWETIPLALVGNLISPGRGILVFFPFAALSIAGIRKISESVRFVALILVSIIASFLTLFSAWGEWAAGISWGPRFFIPLMPFLTLLGFEAMSTLDRFPRGRVTIVSLLIALGALVALQGLLFNPLGFYGTLHLVPAMILSGLYHFDITSSPAIMGWRFDPDPYTYDIFWIQQLAVMPRIAFGVLFTGVIATVFAVTSWIRFFRAQH